MSKTSQILPDTIAEVDARLRKLFIVYGGLMGALLIGFTFAMIPLQSGLAHRFPAEFGWSPSCPTPKALYPSLAGAAVDFNRVFTSPPCIVIDLLSAAIIMAIFTRGIHSLNRQLIAYANHFAGRGDWASAATVLESFNQSGQHFLDSTGEAHYLLSKALVKIGKPQGAAKARDFVLKRRASSEWAAQLRSEESSQSAPLPSRRSVDRRPARSKRQRF